ncbi:MAG: outer membrane protein assembly factor BamA [Geobacteraceae bacterium]|nr:outer membrane protein assembly factor BamA [Geobacteraceae bacterium]NTW80085.1 outer membrane protein assembly factor BamA [Geobacteraceae bacterium]
MPIFKKTTFAILLASISCSTFAYAEGEKLVEIKVQGNRRIDSAAILNVIKLHAGDTLQDEKTDADIRAIYKLGHFQDVKALKEESDKGVVLVYSVQEKAIVREITFVGNKEITTEKLKEALDFRLNSVFSSKDLAKSVAKIKRLYGDEGYYLADVQTQIKNNSPSELTVTVNIIEGDKILIKDIRLDGSKAFSDRKLKGVMETKEKWFMSWLTGAGTYKEEVLKNDALLLSDFYLNNGYVNIKIGEPVVKLNETKTALDVYIGITEGEQYRIGAIGFKGELLDTEADLRKKLKSEQGETFNRSLLRADIGALTDVYGDKGYAFATINPQTRQDNEKKTIDLTFDVEKGDLVYIERINIAGNPKTRDKVVRREVRVTESGLYSATGLKRSKQNLMNLGFFEEANIATSKGSASNKLNVNVDVKEKPTGTFSIGGGYSSLDGFIGQGSVQQANFLGLGLKANLSASLGGKSQTYALGLTDPYFMDTKWTLGGDIYRSERDYDDYSRRLVGADIKGGYPINDYIGTFMMYKFEIKDIYDPSTSYQSLHDTIGNDTYPLGTTTTSSLYSSITHNNTDYRMDPSTGMINSFSLEYAGLGGDNKYARLITDHTYFHPIYKRLIASTKLTLGYIGEVGQPIPIDEKFYLGGIYSLRGYRSRTVAPTSTERILTDPASGSQVIQQLYLGGDTEVFGNVEVTVPLLPEAGLKGVIFFDYGNSVNSTSAVFDTMLMSYGGGIRWASPIGPLRLEYGIPINPRKEIDSTSGRLEFSIGSMF